MIKRLYIFIPVGILVILILIFTFLRSRLTKPVTTPTVTPSTSTFIVSPTITGTLPTLTKQQFDQAMQLQKQSDQKFGKWQGDIYNNYPWYNQLPIKSKTYFVYFDLDKKSFIGAYFTSPSELPAIDSEIKQILKNKGIPIEKYAIKWEKG